MDVNTTNKAPKGTIAIEEAVLNPSGIAWMAETATLFNPSSSSTSSGNPLQHLHGHTTHLLDIHDTRLAQMDAHGVEYMLLSLTSPGPQGQSSPLAAEQLAREANDWLAREVSKNPTRFGALASVSMHDAEEAAGEVRRAVRELGMYGVIINDYQEVEAGGEGDRGKKVQAVWKGVEDLGVPVYMHPRYPPNKELGQGTGTAERKHLLGAAVQFHLDLSKHLYAICSSGVFDEFPGVQVVVGHLGEGIPFNLWRADHWYNKPVKKASRPSKHDYGYYFKHNISITTSGFFSTPGLKFCIDQIGVKRCLFSIDYPYDTIEEAQTWWKGVDLPDKEKEMVARENAIRLFKLPLEL
ncbi:hypothetical protein B0H65DRAFT_509432 [Neurospora tetraspora]|uniref:Amidohydrolase-related domain-containing protein n=1 Tax=Neurospora tetraspora TaxID=94610 RepID=A0AAE0MQE8_9PEZI|nr:hypothetical protein B0H65DRAFT_509432 [Neurospora tetraspora]